MIHTQETEAWGLKPPATCTLRPGPRPASPVSRTPWAVHLSSPVSGVLAGFPTTALSWTQHSLTPAAGDHCAGPGRPPQQGPYCQLTDQDAREAGLGEPSHGQGLTHGKPRLDLLSTGRLRLPVHGDRD